jgi:hypothetical protein
VPSKPGYEKLSQARPSPHTEVAWYPQTRSVTCRSWPARGETQADTDCPVCGRPPGGLLKAASRRSGGLASQAPDLDIDAGAYGPSTETRTRTNIPL